MISFASIGLTSSSWFSFNSNMSSLPLLYISSILTILWLIYANKSPSISGSHCSFFSICDKFFLDFLLWYLFGLYSKEGIFIIFISLFFLLYLQSGLNSSFSLIIEFNLDFLLKLFIPVYILIVFDNVVFGFESLLVSKKRLREKYFFP